MEVSCILWKQSESHSQCGKSNNSNTQRRLGGLCELGLVSIRHLT